MRAFSAGGKRTKKGFRQVQTSVTGEKPAGKLGVMGWTVFEWGLVPCFSLIMVFIFAPYFAKHVVGDPVRGQALWGYTQAVAGALIVIASPFLCSIGDAGGSRKPWIRTFWLSGVAGLLSLWFAEPGAPHGLLPILAGVVLTAVSIEYMYVFHNVMLPSIVPERSLGRWSGFGLAVGYAGTAAALILVLFAFFRPETPLLGLDKATHEPERFIGPLAALWLSFFVLPLFLFTPDRPHSGLSPWQVIRVGVRRLVLTIKALPRFRNIALYLVARMAFYDGMLAVFVFIGIYAAGTFKWSSAALSLFGITLILSSALGAVPGGWIDDRIGSKRTLLMSVGGFALCTLVLLSIDSHTIFFVIESGPSSETSTSANALFTTLPERAYLIGTGFLGFFLGPALASSRTMVARLAPIDMMAQFFGLYSLLGRATTFVAPFVVGVVTELTKSQRLGFSVVLVFMGVGLAMLLFVREERAPSIL